MNSKTLFLLVALFLSGCVTSKYSDYQAHTYEYGYVCGQDTFNVSQGDKIPTRANCTATELDSTEVDLDGGTAATGPPIPAAPVDPMNCYPQVEIGSDGETYTTYVCN